MTVNRRQALGHLAAVLPALSLPARAQDAWSATLARARGQTVYFNAWAGDEKTNDFIAWAGQQVKARHDVAVNHVRLKDTAEAVARVVAEKAAGRDRDGSVDLVWINGPNFLSLKQQGLLHAPVTTPLPNWRYVDTTTKLSNVIDFTTPVDGHAVPWRLAQVVFVIDGARHPDARADPRSAAALLAWARRHPGRLTHPNPANFLGATFLKQMLLDLLDDAAPLQQAATDESFARLTAPLWPWLEQLRPLLWRQGRQFPDNGAAQRQLLNDGELDILVSFNPAEAAVSSRAGLLPTGVRSFTLAKGTLGNTSFVAVPYNARARDGALVLANFLLDPETQARMQGIDSIGALNVLDADRLSPAQRALFERVAAHPALPTAEQLGRPQLEPHASWMTRLTAEWQRRHSR